MTKEAAIPAGPSGPTMVKVPELLSIIYKKTNGYIDKNILYEYAKFAQQNYLVDEPIVKNFISDYMTTQLRLEADNIKMNEGANRIDRELINLPESASTTIKLNELVMRPEPFDGERPKPRRWIAEYNDAIIANGWSDVIAIKYLPTFLNRSAKDWFLTEVKPYLKPSTKWYHIYEVFVENYLGPSERDSLTAAIERSRQRPGESVSNFIPRFRRLLQLSNPSLSELDQMKAIRSRLNPKYKALLEFSDPQNVRELKQICLKIEAGFLSQINGRENTFKNNFKSPGPRTDKPPYQRKFKGGFRSNNNNQRRNVNNITEGQSREPNKHGLKCYNCNKMGHFARDCRSNNFRNTNNSNYTNNKNKYNKKDETSKVQHITGTNSIQDENSQVSHIQQQTETAPTRYILTKQEAKDHATPVNSVTGGGKLIEKKIYCNNVEMSAVVDTGAFVSVIDEIIVNHFKWELKGASEPLIGPGGERLSTRGSVTVEVEIEVNGETKIMKQPFAVVKNLTSPILLGLKLLNDFNICIDCSSRTLFFRHGKQSGGIKNKQTETIPSRSQKLIDANVSPTLTRVNSVLTIPSHQTSGILVAHSINHIAEGSIKLLILNPLNQNVEIPQGTHLADYEIWEDQPTSTNLSKVDNSSPTLEATSINRVIEIRRLSESIIIGDQLNNEQTSQLITILEKHVDAFSLNGEIGCTGVHEHDIELLANAQPFAEPLRRRAVVQIEETRKQVKQLLKEGIIEESQSPWASAYVLAKKKNGEFRLCIDFRKLNSVTKKVVYPLPNIDDCLETLSGKQYFSQIDFKSGFWQIGVKKESRELTAFRTEDGLFHFKRMPFGLTNAPASFQKMINTVLSGLKGLNLQVFIDDVCVATKNWPEHLMMLDSLLSVVKKSKLKIKADKCVFGSSSVQFLGHQISAKGIKQDPNKLRALTSLPEPTDVGELRRALGMFSYYRKFVPKFSHLAEPLNRLTRKGVDFIWQDEHKQAFKDIIQGLAQDATLAHYNHQDPIMVKTDASRKGIAGLLLQKQEGSWKLVTCCSRRLAANEANYGITDLEGLAVVYTIDKLRPYLLGKKFQILVDHCALCSLNKNFPKSARLQRWAIVLSEFEFEIVYTKGSQHCDIDCLSRAPVDNPTDPYLDNRVYLITPMDKFSWLTEYANSQESRTLLQKAFDKEDSLKIVDDLIYKDELLYVPLAKRSEIMQTAHNNNMSAHPGILATTSKIKENYWWPSLQQDVTDYVNTCSTCIVNKPIRQKPAGTMESFQILQPGEQVSIDLIENITESHNGNQHIIVAIDMFTRFVEAKAVPDKGAPTFTQFLIEYCGRYGVPHSFLTDQSTTFCNEFTKTIMKVFGASHVKSTPYHSQGNAVVERVNQKIEEKIRLVLDDPLQERNWDAALPIAVLAINTTTHISIGCTPYQLTFGKRPPLQDKNLCIKTRPQDLYARLIQQTFNELYGTAIAINSTSQEKSRKYFDQNHRRSLFDIGDSVYFKTPSRSSKLSPKYQGPYKIIGVKKDIYTVESPDGKIYTRHVNDLRGNMGTMAQNTTRNNNSVFNIKNIASLATILLVVACIDAKLFDKVKPIIWLKLKSQVNIGVTEYDINFAYTDPCLLFRKNIQANRLRDELSSDEDAKLTAFEKNCQALYIIEWQEEVEQLLKVNLPRFNLEHLENKDETPYHENVSKTKRSILPIGAVNTTEDFSSLNNHKFTRYINAFIFGPFEPLITEYTDRILAYRIRLAQLSELRDKIQNSSALDIYLSRKANEFDHFDKLPPPKASELAKYNLTPDLRWYEWIPFFVAQPVYFYIRDPILERTYRERIDKVKKEIQAHLRGTALDHLLSQVSMHQSLNASSQVKTLTRRRRGTLSNLLTETASQAIGAFTGNIVTNLISIAIERFYPNSNYNRIGRLEEAYEGMKKNFEIQKQFNRGILENLDKLSNLVQETMHRINENTETFPQYTWLSSLIVSKLGQSSIDLQRIADEARRGRIATEPFVRLTGLTELRTISSANTRLLSVARVNNYTINFKFLTAIASPDTHAFKIQSFNHWDNLDATPRLLKYTGAKYLIYNETANCIKALLDQPDQYVAETCEELDGDDPALNQWDTVIETEEIEKYSSDSQVYKTLLFNYIYCFPGSISIDSKQYKCPTDAFRLKTNREFKTAKQRHIPKMVTGNYTQFDQAYDTVHAAHFKEDSDVIQHLAMFEQLRAERRSLHNLTDSINTSVVIKRSSPWLWVSIAYIVASLTGALVKVIIILYIKFFNKGGLVAAGSNLLRQASVPVYQHENAHEMQGLGGLYK